MPLIEMTLGGSRFLSAVLSQCGKTPASLSEAVGLKIAACPSQRRGTIPRLDKRPRTHSSQDDCSK